MAPVVVATSARVATWVDVDVPGVQLSGAFAVPPLGCNVMEVGPGSFEPNVGPWVTLTGTAEPVASENARSG